jgi:hypothetical protein
VKKRPVVTVVISMSLQSFHLLIFMFMGKLLLSLSLPIAMHQLVIVEPGGNAVVRLTSYDMSGNVLNYTLAALPTSGAKIFQLSQVFSTYGYNPVAGQLIVASETVITGSLNRFYYERPVVDNGGDNLVSKFMVIFIVKILILPDFSFFLQVGCLNFYLRVRLH